MAIGLNTTPDGFCRTLKAQYYKNSCANFMEGNHFGATGGVSKRMRIDIDVNEIKNLNWCHYTIKSLGQSIKEWKKK